MKIFKEIKIVPHTNLNKFIVKRYDTHRHHVPSYRIYLPDTIYYIMIGLGKGKTSTHIYGSPYNTGGHYGNYFKYNEEKQQYTVRGYTRDGVALESKKAYELYQTHIPNHADPKGVATYTYFQYEYNELRPYFIAKSVPSNFVLDVWDDVYMLAGGMIKVTLSYGRMVYDLVQVDISILDYLETAANENI